MKSNVGKNEVRVLRQPPSQKQEGDFGDRKDPTSQVPPCKYCPGRTYKAQ
jgi:hypothetical protein